MNELDSIVGALKIIPLHALESYDLVVGVHDMINGLERLRPFVVLHETKCDVHYTFEGDDKLQVIYYCKRIAEARVLVTSSIRELGHTSVDPSTY